MPYKVAVEYCIQLKPPDGVRTIDVIADVPVHLPATKGERAAVALFSVTESSLVDF